MERLKAHPSRRYTEQRRMRHFETRICTASLRCWMLSDAVGLVRERWLLTC